MVYKGLKWRRVNGGKRYLSHILYKWVTSVNNSKHYHSFHGFWPGFDESRSFVGFTYDWMTSGASFLSQSSCVEMQTQANANYLCPLYPLPCASCYLGHWCRSSEEWVQITFDYNLHLVAWKTTRTLKIVLTIYFHTLASSKYKVNIWINLNLKLVTQ